MSLLTSTSLTPKINVWAAATHEQNARRELQRIRTKMVPDNFSCTTSRDEKENVTIFIGTLSSTYYDRLISHVGASSMNLVQNRERIEDGLKKGKSKDYQTLFVQTSTGTKGSKRKNFFNKKMKMMCMPFLKLLDSNRLMSLSPPIYQLTAPPPPPPMYCTMYPTPPVYHPP